MNGHVIELRKQDAQKLVSELIYIGIFFKVDHTREGLVQIISHDGRFEEIAGRYGEVMEKEEDERKKPR
jgi:hypothetical protein